MSMRQVLNPRWGGHAVHIGGLRVDRESCLRLVPPKCCHKHTVETKNTILNALTDDDEHRKMSYGETFIVVRLMTNEKHFGYHVLYPLVTSGQRSPRRSLPRLPTYTDVCKTSLYNIGANSIADKKNTYTRRICFLTRCPQWCITSPNKCINFTVLISYLSNQNVRNVF